MATTDTNGILFYEDTDAVSPLHTLLNTGQQSVTNAVTALKTDPSAPFATAAGSATVSSAAAPLSNTVAVVFPTGRFAVAPKVFAQHVSSAALVDGFMTLVSDITATGFNLRVYRVNGGVWSSGQPVNWTATQMTSTSAAG